MIRNLIFLAIFLILLFYLFPTKETQYFRRRTKNKKKLLKLGYKMEYALLRLKNGNVILFNDAEFKKGNKFVSVISIEDNQYGIMSEQPFYFILPKAMSVTVRAVADKSKKIGLADLKGEMLTSFEFDDIFAFYYSTNYFFGVKINNMWGIVNERSEFVVEPKYNSLFIIPEYGQEILVKKKVESLLKTFESTKMHPN